MPTLRLREHLALYLFFDFSLPLAVRQWHAVDDKDARSYDPGSRLTSSSLRLDFGT